MRKIEILGAFIAVLAFSALAVASAGATQWLFKSEAIEGTAHASNRDGTIEINKESGSLGSGVVKCSVTLVELIGPAGADSTLEVTALNGTEKNLVKCERVSGFCFSPVLHALKLPWKTELVLRSGVLWDEISGSEYELLCVIGMVACKGEEQAKFLKNSTAGAEFGFEGKESGEGACNDGGTSNITGKGTSLGVTVS
ncbi:MAG: hypothetical protein ACTHM1_11505 [Solirubrobacteraceae bacterium]